MSTRIIIGPNKIYYSDNSNYKNPKCVEKYDGYLFLSPYDIGMVKSTCWEFEREWRFKISPFSMETTFPDESYTYDNILNFTKYPIQNNHIDVNLDPTVFDEMEILMGPRASIAEEILVESLLGRYAAKSELKKSVLAIR